MPAPPEKPSLPQWVNPKKFAHQGVSLSGQIAVEKLQRLSREIANDPASPSPTVTVDVSFDLDDESHRRITGKAQAEIHMTCQRCLQPAPVTLQADISLAVVTSDREAKALPKRMDPWLVEDPEGQADLYRAVEEELLLSLPMVAYHQEQCIDPQLYSSGENSEPQAENPFRVLKDLKATKSNC